MKTNTGVYQIFFESDITKSYIGSSADIKRRWGRHKSDLKNGNHPNKPLQETYSKYGIDNLKLFVIEYLPDDTPKDARFAVEQYWMDTVGFDNLYNAYPNAGSPEGVIVAEETRKKLSEVKIKFHQENPEFIKGENNPMHNEETRQKISEALTGKPSHRRNIEVWDKYPLIKELHRENPELGHRALCTLFNKTFGTNYPGDSFQNILPKIKEEIIQENS